MQKGKNCLEQLNFYKGEQPHDSWDCLQITFFYLVWKKVTEMENNFELLYERFFTRNNFPVKIWAN